MFSYPKVVPDLVEDVSLKRARGEDGTIKTSPEALGKVDDAAWDGSDPEATVISLLKGIVNKLQWFYIDLYTKLTSNPTFTIGKIVSSQAVSYSVASGDIELTNWQTFSGGSFTVPSGSSAFICNPNTNYGDTQLVFIRRSSGVSFSLQPNTKYVLFTSEYYNYMKIVDTQGNVRLIMTDVVANDGGASVIRIQGNDLSHLV